MLVLSFIAFAPMHIFHRIVGGLVVLCPAATLHEVFVFYFHDVRLSYSIFCAEIEFGCTYPIALLVPWLSLCVSCTA
jgi:hypothetical protein